MVSIVYGAWHEGGWQPTKMVRRYRSRQTSAALFAGCRAVWRQIWPLQCRYARPPFNGAAAVGCFLLSSSLLFSSCLVSNKNRNDAAIAIWHLYMLYWCCRYTVALIGRGLIKVLIILIIQRFAVSVEKLGSVL